MNSNLLLLDVFHLCLAMLVLGLIAFELIRRGNPLIRWHEHGNVWTEPFRWVDLAILAALTALFYANLQVVTSNGEELKEITAKTDDLKMSLTVLVGAFAQGILALGVVFLLHSRGTNIFELFGLSRLSPKQVALWSIGVLFVALLVINEASTIWANHLEKAFGGEMEKQDLVDSFANAGLGLKLVIAFSACILAPIFEEILFRGFFYGTLKRFSERFFAAITVSLLFALVHSNLASLVPLFLLAMAFTIAYELTGCLYVPIAMHSIFNTIMVVSMFAEAAS